MNLIYNITDSLYDKYKNFDAVYLPVFPFKKRYGYKVDNAIFKPLKEDVPLISKVIQASFMVKNQLNGITYDPANYKATINGVDFYFNMCYNSESVNDINQYAFAAGINSLSEQLLKNSDNDDIKIATSFFSYKPYNDKKYYFLRYMKKFFSTRKDEFLALYPHKNITYVCFFPDYFRIDDATKAYIKRSFDYIEAQENQRVPEVIPIVHMVPNMNIFRFNQENDQIRNPINMEWRG